jgi:hypothetical protein
VDSSVYCLLLVAVDFGQQRVNREWFGDHGICLCDRISQHLGWPLTTITGTSAVAGAAGTPVIGSDLLHAA